MPYNSVADSIYTKKLCSRLTVSSEMQFRRPFCVFAPPPTGRSGATYAVHLRLTGKCVVDFLLATIEVLSLGVTAEAPRANIDWKSAFLQERGQFGQNFRNKGFSPTKHSSCRKTRMIDLSDGIKYGQKFISFCHNSRVWRMDRKTIGQTNGQTFFSWLIPACTVCSAVKTTHTYTVFHLHFAMSGELYLWRVGGTRRRRRRGSVVGHGLGVSKDRKTLSFTDELPFSGSVSLCVRSV